MKQIDLLFADYASYHRTRGNILCHFFGIPLIVYAILGFLQYWKIGPVSAAEIVIVISTAFYLMLDSRLAACMLTMTVILDVCAYKVSSLKIAGLAFLAGWILQALGHAIFEKRSPAFLKNMIHLMVGPIFVLNEVLRVRPVASPKAESSDSF
jgi:uncharacterized membrane protein YGL010W